VRAIQFTASVSLPLGTIYPQVKDQNGFEEVGPLISGSYPNYVISPVTFSHGDTYTVSFGSLGSSCSTPLHDATFTVS
jgi:hypothetical protein